MKWRDSKKNYSENRISKQHLLIAAEFIPFGATPRRFCLGLLKVLCGDLLNKNYTGITETVSHWYAESALLWDIRRRYYTEIARKRAKFKGAIMPERSFLMSNYYFNLLSQAQKLYRHNRQGSYKTRERYFEAYKRFLKFVGCEYNFKALRISAEALSGI